MSYLTIQINAANVSAEDMNTKLLEGDATKAREIVLQIRNLMDAIAAGNCPSTVTAVSSTVAGTVSEQTGGDSVSLNLR